MDNSYDQFHRNGNISTDPSTLQIIPHHPSARFSLHWFDIRVFYVRITNFTADNSTPEYLTLNHIPVGPKTILEVNGGVRCSIDSQEGISCTLRRHHVDKESEEATFVSTDSIRFTGSVRFEVFDKDYDLVISGVLELMSSDTNDCVGESNNNNNTARRWMMNNCESIMNAGTGFLKGSGSESLLPRVEVYVAGCFSGTPIVLTKTLQVKHPTKKHRKGMLDSIPENDGEDHFASGHDLQVGDEYRDYKEAEREEEYDDNLYRRRQPTEYMEGDGELSWWFNAGVRVGVGIGLGICLGIGIGAGLLLRTYQTTTRVFKTQLR